VSFEDTCIVPSGASGIVRPLGSYFPLSPLIYSTVLALFVLLEIDVGLISLDNNNMDVRQTGGNRAVFS